MKLKPTKSSTFFSARANFATVCLMAVFTLPATVQVRSIQARQASDSVAPPQDQPSDAEPSGTSGASATPLELIKEHLEAARTHVFSLEAATDLPLLSGVYEPTVAVDPHNPLRVAMASGFQLRVSTNGGVSFQPAVFATVPANYQNCGDNSLAFDSQGRLFWNYLGCLGGTNPDVFISQANPTNGTIIAGPVNISVAIGSAAGSLHSNDKEWLAADSTTGSRFQDRLYVVWTDLIPGAIRAAYSANQGVTWTVSTLPAQGAENFVWPSHNTVA